MAQIIRVAEMASRDKWRGIEGLTWDEWEDVAEPRWC